jgi:hypothetical protein
MDTTYTWDARGNGLLAGRVVIGGLVNVAARRMAAPRRA